MINLDEFKHYNDDESPGKGLFPPLFPYSLPLLSLLWPENQPHRLDIAKRIEEQFYMFIQRSRLEMFMYIYICICTFCDGQPDGRSGCRGFLLTCVNAERFAPLVEGAAPEGAAQEPVHHRHVPRLQRGRTHHRGSGHRPLLHPQLHHQVSRASQVPRWCVFTVYLSKCKSM